MKSFVLEKTKYFLTNSWIGLLLPAGVHHLLQVAEKSSSPVPEKNVSGFRSHPAESRISRHAGSKAKP
jgi:hypothetical protein